MKRYLAILCSLVTLIAVSASVAYAKFPERPINLIVYTKPGGAIDVFSRKFAAIASKYTDAEFVVLNKDGAGGMVAIKHIISGKADGYQLAAVTRSNIGKMVSTGNEADIDKLTWLAMLVSDPEAIITLKGSKVETWEQIIADAKAKNGEQLWVGPAAGGNDHIMAMRTWKAAGISAKWVPFKSGGKAMAALMGEHGAVYVGNPQDVIGKPDLMVAVIASEKRLDGEFANVPTFNELGIKGLDDEIMWRGFMLKKGVPQEAYDFYMDLLNKVNADPEWQAYISRGGANPVLYDEKQFTDIVKKDVETFSEHLRQLGVLK